MRILVAFAAMIALLLAMPGCTTAQTVAKGLAAKNTSGDGQVILNKVTVMDPETGSYTPELFSMLVNGRFMNLLKDANILNYTRVITPAWYNKDNVTVSESIIISVQKNGNLAETVKNAAEVIKQQNARIALENPSTAISLSTAVQSAISK